MSRRFRYDPATDSVVEVGAPAARIGDWKELHCEAMAWDGNVEDAKRIDRELGAPEVPYDYANRPVFKDRETYNNYLKAHGKENYTSGKVKHTLAPGELERAMERVRE